MRWWRAWRRQRILRTGELDPGLWREVLELPLFAGLDAEEQARLREKVILFLHGKTFTAVQGAVATARARLMVAAQASLLALNLDDGAYEGWREIIFYPDEFLTRHQYTDDAGVVHEVRYPMLGEAWLGGPVILSEADVETSVERDGLNVVLHEFAHKLDMQNGPANGLPQLHGDMRVRDWARAFGAAYEDFCRRVDAGEETAIDPYAAESPAEFFAVLTEAFFETPAILARPYPEVYEQMRRYYRQHPLKRLTT